MLLFFKIRRLIDIFVSLLGLIILSPLYVILMIAITLDSKRPVLFKQKRVRINESHFYILKFRTMPIDTPKHTPTHLLGNPDQYRTRVRKFLRTTPLDELPQIGNILVGDMS